jgi:superfamily II DNA or RNA helicase
MFSRSNVLEDVFLWNCLVRKLVKNTEFNMGLVQLIKNYASLDGSKILVVTSRVEHAKMLYKVLVQYLPAKKIQLLIGGVRNAILDYDMYIGTDAYISEGIDIPSLNTLIITLPLQRNIKQLVGRLFRHISGKKITIVDFEWNSVPSISRLIENNRSRFQYYASLGCQIIDKEEVA